MTRILGSKPEKYNKNQQFARMVPNYLDKQTIIRLLPMQDCISVMERTFRALAAGQCLQPLRDLLWLPDKRGILGMMPGYASGPEILGIKVITVFHGNGAIGLPSHQGVVMLFDAQHGTPLLLLDAAAITAIRTAAASALATRLLARENAARLAILGTGEQAEQHAHAIALVRPLTAITIWGRNEMHAANLAHKLGSSRDIGDIPIQIAATAQEAVEDADIICTVTSSPSPVLIGSWIPEGAHLNVVGACTPGTREVDTQAVLRSRLFTDRYESLFNEAGEFLIPKQEGYLDESFAQAEIAQVLTGAKPGRTAAADITLFKSLGIAAEDLFAAKHIYDQLKD
jgi:ornithine cyclodeaminase/alanine dehydrogenase-like protein (mu-crystallin family)